MGRNMLRRHVRETWLNMYTTVHYFIKMTTNSNRLVKLLTTFSNAM
jgi:hypothetical protein